MPSAIKAGLLYFVIVFAAGFVLGALRVIVLMPFIGEVASVAFELPVMLVISWLACRRLATQFSVPARIPHRLAMGAAAFGLLMSAEFSLSAFLFNRSAAEYFALFLTASGLLGIAGQIAFGLFPVLQLRQKGN